MKKVLFLAAAAAFLSLTACKKEYTCCFTDSNGEKNTCTTTKMTKSEKDDVEAAGQATAALTGETYSCE